MAAPELDIHPASPDETVAAHRNVFDIWSKGMPMAEHVRHRLESPSHRRATWYVGCLAGRVVVSLGCYPIRFHVAGQQLPGIAIGSVYTLSEFRGHGFAPRLLAWVERHEQQRGAALSVLYSDIKPEYYARLGYVRCPSLTARHVLADRPDAGADCARLEPIDAQAELPTLMRLYDNDHGARPLSVARDTEYWQAMLLKFPTDKFYALRDRAGQLAGYVRVGHKETSWRITDYALRDGSVTLGEQLYGALFEFAAAEGARQIEGWLPDSPAARARFQLEPRVVEITMAKPLDSRVALDDTMVAAAGYFCEIDHV